MAVTTPTHARRGDRTRAAIVRAATDDLAAHGFDGLRGTRVAALAGVSEATVWHHFGSKAGLLAAVMETYYAALLVEMDEVLASGEGPLDRLHAVARWWPRHNLPRWPLLGQFSREGRGGGDEDVVETFRSCNRRVTQRFDRLLEDCRAVGVLRPDAPLRTLRDAFFGGVEHLLLGHLATGRPEDPAAASAELLDLLLVGAATTATATAPTDADGVLARLTVVEQGLTEVLDRLDRLGGS